MLHSFFYIINPWEMAMNLDLFIVTVSRCKKYSSIKMNDMTQGRFFTYAVSCKYGTRMS
jgi:hypothetical protein